MNKSECEKNGCAAVKNVFCRVAQLPSRLGIFRFDGIATNPLNRYNRLCPLQKFNAETPPA
jgi:hypothetical protein